MAILNVILTLTVRVPTLCRVCGEHVFYPCVLYAVITCSNPLCPVCGEQTGTFPGNFVVDIQQAADIQVSRDAALAAKVRLLAAKVGLFYCGRRRFQPRFCVFGPDSNPPFRASTRTYAHLHARTRICTHVR